MQIHNFYADLLTSTRILFDNYIFFTPNYIKRYEYNIGSRMLQLGKEYETQQNFPVAIVNLNDDNATFGTRHEVDQKLQIGNTNQIPVLYCKETDLILYLQENHYTIPISVQVNCESQLQAKEVQNQIRRSLPVNKYIEVMNFTSFLELPIQFTGEEYFNPNKYDILNLYCKKDQKTGYTNYCFSVSYKPLIKLESVSTSISDSTARSFQVSADFSYIIQFPMYTFLNRLDPKIERINLDFNITQQPITDYPLDQIFSKNSKEIFARRRLILGPRDVNPLTLDVLITEVILLSGNISTSSNNGRISVTLKPSGELLIRYLNGFYKIIPTTEEQFIVVQNGKLSVSIDNSNNIIVTELNQRVHLIIHFNSEDFIFKPEYFYGFFSNGKEMLHNYPFILNQEENKVTFEFEKFDWDNYYRPTETRALLFLIFDKGEYPLSAYVEKEISLVHTSSITSNTASILWTSLNKTTTQIEYGIDTTYGSFSNFDYKLIHNHRVDLYQLSSLTLYHYRIIFMDHCDKQIVSDDYTFTTL